MVSSISLPLRQSFECLKGCPLSVRGILVVFLREESFLSEVDIIFELMNHSISTMTGKTKIKVVFLGGQAVGKSSIIEKYIHNRFDETANPTVGIDFLAKNVSHRARNYRLQLWDTAGQERFRSLIPSYLKDAHCALIVFDVTNSNTLAEVDSWVALFNENRVGDSFVLLVANKIDLPNREVSPEQGRQKAEGLGVGYFEMSAKTGEGIEELFQQLIEGCAERAVPRGLGGQRKPGGVEAVKEEVKVNADETNTKINEQLQRVESVVLKNEKISKGEGAKGCC